MLLPVAQSPIFFTFFFLTRERLFSDFFNLVLRFEFYSSRFVSKNILFRELRMGLIQALTSPTFYLLLVRYISVYFQIQYERDYWPIKGLFNFSPQSQNHDKKKTTTKRNVRKN